MSWKLTTALVGMAMFASASAASADGELNIFNWGNYTSPEMIKKFEDTYKVKVTITDFDSNDAALGLILEMDFDLRRLVDPQHAIVVEVRLLDAALGDGDLAVKCRGQAEDEPAFELGLDRVGIDSDAGVDRRDDTT